MMLQRVMIYFCEYRMLHDKAWLIKWVRCLLNFQCNNILMVCPNSVATRRCLSRWYIWTPVTFLFSLVAFPFPTNVLTSRSHISLHWQAHCNSPALGQSFFSTQCWIFSYRLWGFNILHNLCRTLWFGKISILWEIMICLWIQYISNNHFKFFDQYKLKFCLICWCFQKYFLELFKSLWLEKLTDNHLNPSEYSFNIGNISLHIYWIACWSVISSCKEWHILTNVTNRELS